MSPCYFAIAHARVLEYSSLSTLAGLSYHICGKLEVAFKASPSSQYQHRTDEAQKAETVPSAVIYIYIYIVVITVESKGRASVFCLKLHADENNGSIKWKIMSDPCFPRLCQSKVQL